MPAAVAAQREVRIWEARQKLQGTWTPVSGRWNCRLHFTECNFALQFDGGEIYMGAYDVDPTQSPCVLDMDVEEGPDKFRGLTALCIYELDGETLRWCPNEPGCADRPAAFPEDPWAKFPTLVFKREGA